MSDDGGTVVVLGGGGHAKVLISVIRKLPWTIAGYVDPRDVGPVLGVPHAGDDDVLPALLVRHPGCAAAMGVGKVDATARRARIQSAAEALGYAIPHLRLARTPWSTARWSWGPAPSSSTGPSSTRVLSPGPPASSTPTPPWNTTVISARTSTSAPAPR